MKDTLFPLKKALADVINHRYNREIGLDELVLSPTKKEFEGDYTLVAFGLSKLLQQKPNEIAQSIGEALLALGESVVVRFNVVQGFLNITMSHLFWHGMLETLSQDDWYEWPQNGQRVLVEFSSPNTNKPLHLGHIRNILLGWSTYKILEKTGHDVIRTQIINDRGIAICKSMLAWQLFGLGITPKKANIKGDHLVGEYYRKYETAFMEEYRLWQESTHGVAQYEQHHKDSQSKDEFYKAYKNQYANEHSLLGKQAKEMLIAWENNDPEVRSLWAQMNGWVYEGFNETYKRLGVSFDKLYFESSTYLLGKDIIQRGIENEAFYRQEDGSVWVNLEDVGLDQKILLRSDGTSVYMTQDLGTADQRYKDTQAHKMIYVVADEQDYHFKALFEIMKKLAAPYAQGLYHLSYGMVDLPSGRMKSREGTVVDADDLLSEVETEVEQNAADRTELDDLSSTMRSAIYHKIALAAIKFFILKVNPKKRMVFDPTESVDIQGQTGPYIQNAFVRINSIQRKLPQWSDGQYEDYTQLSDSERDVLRIAADCRHQINQAADAYDPSSIATFAYELAKSFHRMYHEMRIINAESPGAKQFRLQLASVVARQLTLTMDLIGIEMPERM